MKEDLSPEIRAIHELFRPYLPKAAQHVAALLVIVNSVGAELPSDRELFDSCAEECVTAATDDPAKRDELREELRLLGDRIFRATDVLRASAGPLDVKLIPPT